MAANPPSRSAREAKPGKPSPAGRPNSTNGPAEGIFSKCASCGEIIYSREIESNHKVCPRCGFHFPLTVAERIELLADSGSFAEWDAGLRPVDALKFSALKSYTETLLEAASRTGLTEAAVSGEARIGEIRTALVVMDFRFVGGSMGSVVGEKVARVFERAAADKLPVLVVAASGGARMQEGMLSLMQMAKTAAAVGRFRRSGGFYLSLLTHPTTGGVTASFATLGGVILAEPGALIGFAGPRVVEQTIKQKLPKGFQTAEFLLEHGLVDAVVNRARQKSVIADLLAAFER